MFLEIFTTILGVLMSIGYFPQAYKIYKTKSSKDVSIFTYLIFSIGTLVWTLYGIVTNDMVIVYSFAVGVVGSWLVLALILRYRGKSTKIQDNKIL